MKKVTIPLFQIDAFSNKAFAGNPAAVCLLDAEKNVTWMQSVAMEMNLSETAFVRRIDKGFELRWFTPTHEVDLCGHAILAAGHVLWEQGLNSVLARMEANFAGVEEAILLNDRGCVAEGTADNLFIVRDEQ
jgi:PhzF family phenazine biosynthesis protein